jgi:hypothetical protein
METPMPDQTPAAEILDRLVPHLRKITEQLEQINIRLDKGLVQAPADVEYRIEVTDPVIASARHQSLIEQAGDWEAGTVGDLAAEAAVADLLRHAAERQGLPVAYLRNAWSNTSDSLRGAGSEPAARDFANGPEL